VTQAEAPAPSSSRWYVSSAPPRQRLLVIVVETIVSLVALGIVAALTALTREPWLIPPLAASMALVIGGAHFPLSQPRNVIGGHIMSAIVGIFVGTIGIDALWGGALAGALALGVMKLMRMSHSPARRDRDDRCRTCHSPLGIRRPDRFCRNHSGRRGSGG
jgi:CBS-domain-containing membrane protein